MKKLKIVALLGFITCSCAGLAACTKSLGRPTGLLYDKENYTIEWNPVENAYGYEIVIKDEDGTIKGEDTRREPAYSIDGLSLEEGYYEVQVKAISKGTKNKNSDWSNPYEFYKEYETGCVYTLINNTEYEISDATQDTKGKVVIEAYYKGKPVTSIADNAFKGASLVTEVVLGENIRTIGDNAFYNCTKLEKITFNDNIETIGLAAFHSCKALKEVKLPKNLKKISDGTFWECRALESVTLNDRLEIIGDSAFSDCAMLSSIEIPDSVKEIGDNAFSNSYAQGKEEKPETGLKKVSIGKGVEWIGEKAFDRCILLEEVVFAKDSNLQEISDYAFQSCENLKNIILPTRLEKIGDGCFFKCKKLESVKIPDSVLSVGAYAFMSTTLYDNSLAENNGYVYADKWLIDTSVEIRATLPKITLTSFKDGIIGIADEAFSYCLVLTEAIIPQTVQSIGKNAFFGCEQLVKVQTNDYSLKVIDEAAFKNCKKLNRLLLGQGLEKIGAYAFYNCTLLNGMNLIPSTVTSVGTDAFKNTDIWNKQSGVVYVGKWIVGFNENGNLSTVNLPANSVDGIADYAFYQCTALSSIYGVDQVKYIGKGAFYGCTNLAAITLNRNLTEIKDYTFYKCSSLFRVEMPRALLSIGRSAFYKCQQLDLIDLSDSRRVTHIDNYAFYGCFNAKSLSLGEGVEEIGDYAFYKCTSVQELTIPASVREIGERAFSRCSALQTLTIETQEKNDEKLGLETINAYAFSNCTALKSVMLPETVITVGDYAFYKCESVEQITMEENVETIGNYAFYNCINVTTLSLPQTINHIGRYAFKGVAIDALMLSKEILEIGEMAFYGNKMTVYTDVSSKSEMTWDEKWNRGYRPVVWGCTLSEDGAYVVSITIQDSTFENIDAVGGIKAPTRVGYTFAGWSTNADADVGEIKVIELPNVTVGTTVYAIWQENASVQE